MYDIKVTLTDQQYNLLSEALFYYSEEKDDPNIEELEDLIDSNSKKVSVKRKYIRPEADCDI
tara:strand:- start:143 stop:328 length:186 start_codon:yes stop_codon:yes gene_type:complete